MRWEGQWPTLVPLVLAIGKTLAQLERLVQSQTWVPLIILPPTVAVTMALDDLVREPVTFIGIPD
jgi:hypothetical protein